MPSLLSLSTEKIKINSLNNQYRGCNLSMQSYLVYPNVTINKGSSDDAPQAQSQSGASIFFSVFLSRDTFKLDSQGTASGTVP